MQTHHVVSLDLHIDSHLCTVSILATASLTLEHITTRSRRKRECACVFVAVMCMCMCVCVCACGFVAVMCIVKCVFYFVYVYLCEHVNVQANYGIRYFAISESSSFEADRRSTNCTTTAQQKLGGGALTARNDLCVGFATLRFGEQALQHCFTANLQSPGFELPCLTFLHA